MYFFSPVRNDPKKTHTQLFGTHPVPGQSRKSVYVYVFFLFLPDFADGNAPGTEPELETGTVGTVFPGTERGTRTARTVFQEPKPEPEPSSVLNCTENHKNPSLEEPPEPKTEPIEPFHPQTVTEPNRGPPFVDIWTSLTCLVCNMSGSAVFLPIVYR